MAGQARVMGQGQFDPFRVGDHTTRVPGALPPATELRPCRAFGDGHDAQVALLRLPSRQEFLPIMGSSKAINAQDDSNGTFSRSP